MGLDLVEYVVAVEDAFQIAIPDADAALVTTPAQLIDYVCARVRMSEDSPPLMQSAFYRLREVLIAELRVTRESVRPSVRIADWTTRDERDVWRVVAGRIGVPVKVLTHAAEPQWLTKFSPRPAQTIGAVARQLAMLRPAALKAGDRTWTREQITAVALQLLEYEIGIAVGSEELHLTFVRDLGMG